MNPIVRNADRIALVKIRRALAAAPNPVPGIPKKWLRVAPGIGIMTGPERPNAVLTGQITIHRIISDFVALKVCGYRNDRCR